MPRRFNFKTSQKAKRLSPHPGPQSYFVSSPIEDTAYGGARGPGKSFGLLLDVAARVERYGGDFHGLMVRRTYKEMSDLIRKGFEVLYPWGAKWYASDQVWEWTNGASLHMGHLESPADAMGYQGWEISAFYVDEMGNFETPDVLDQLWGSLRSPAGIPVVRRSSINPGGVGHAWVKQRYLSHPVMKPFKYQPQPELAPQIWRNAVFIPGRLEDNPTLMQNDPEYEARLALVGGAALYRAWRYGDWDAVAGLYFDCWSDSENIKTIELMPWWPRWISMDWGFVHPSAIGWFTQDDAGHVHQYKELLVKGMTPEALADLIVSETDEPIEMFILSPDAWQRKTTDRTIAVVLGEALAAKHLAAPIRADTRRKGDSARLMEQLKRGVAPTQADTDYVGGWMYMYQEIKARRFTVDPSCKETVASIKRMVHDPKNPEDALKIDATDKYGGDDAAEMVRMSLKTRARGGVKPYELRVREATKEFYGEEDIKNIDPTSLAIHAARIEAEVKKGNKPLTLGRHWR